MKQERLLGAALIVRFQAFWQNCWQRKWRKEKWTKKKKKKKKKKKQENLLQQGWPKQKQAIKVFKTPIALLISP